MQFEVIIGLTIMGRAIIPCSTNLVNVRVIFWGFCSYLLLTEFDVRTVSYGPSFSPFDYGPSADGKKRGSVTYSTDRENEVSKIFVISLRLIRRAEKKVSGPYLALINRAGGLYGRILTEVVSTDRTQ